MLKGCLIAAGLIVVIVVGLITLGAIGINEALDTKITYNESMSGTEKEDVRKVFIVGCSSSIQSQLKQSGVTVDANVEDKTRFACGCAAPQVLPRINGMTIGEVFGMSETDPRRQSFEGTLQQCFRQVGLQ